MDAKLVQSLFDSGLRSQFAWRHKAMLLFNAGITVLEKAAKAQPVAEVAFKNGTKELTSEEMEPFHVYQTYDVGFFLVALAIENLLKALWVGRNHQRVSQVASMRSELKEITTHELGKIAKEAGLNLSTDEEGLLSDLSKIVVWFGRYSLPTRVEDYRTHFKSGPPSNRFLREKHIFSMELPMPQELELFLQRLIKELETIPEQFRS